MGTRGATDLFGSEDQRRTAIGFVREADGPLPHARLDKARRELVSSNRHRNVTSPLHLTLRESSYG
jgi:hypothetical protein